jgi:hypothetical protein
MGRDFSLRHMTMHNFEVRFFALLRLMQIERWTGKIDFYGHRYVPRYPLPTKDKTTLET